MRARPPLIRDNHTRRGVGSTIVSKQLRDRQALCLISTFSCVDPYLGRKVLPLGSIGRNGAKIGVFDHLAERVSPIETLHSIEHFHPAGLLIADQIRILLIFKGKTSCAQ
jgi:hypothetical protein